MAETMPIKCARRDVLLEALPNKILACPKCGERDTFDKVMADIGEFITRAMAHRHSGQDRAEPHTTTRFIVDLASPEKR